jgi:hypothetical protein
MIAQGGHGPGRRPWMPYPLGLRFWRDALSSFKRYVEGGTNGHT